MTRHTPEQIIPKLRQAEADLAQGLNIAQVCQKLGVSEQTLHRWRNRYGGMKAEEAKRLKELEAENERKKRRLGSGENGCARKRPEYRGHVWAWDFMHDRTADGRPLKWFTLVDEYTRECLALEVGRRMTAKGVSEVLAGVIRERGAPA